MLCGADQAQHMSGPLVWLSLSSLLPPRGSATRAEDYLSLGLNAFGLGSEHRQAAVHPGKVAVLLSALVYL